MITTGIIKSINAGEKLNKCNIELAIFKNQGDPNPINCIYEANISLPGGLASTYKVDDLVYVSFVNNQLMYPVILGKIYKNLPEEGRGFAFLDSLKVTTSVELPKDSKIADLNIYTTLKDLLVRIQNLESKTDI